MFGSIQTASLPSTSQASMVVEESCLVPAERDSLPDRRDSLLIYMTVFLTIGLILGMCCAVRFPWAVRWIGPSSFGPSRPPRPARPPSRSIAVQSQCTYKRQWQTPRFSVLPEDSSGAFAP